MKKAFLAFLSPFNPENHYLYLSIIMEIMCVVSMLFLAVHGAKCRKKLFLLSAKAEHRKKATQKVRPGVSGGDRRKNRNFWPEKISRCCQKLKIEFFVNVNKS